MNERRIKGLVGSLAAHAALLAWVVGRSEPPPEPEDPPDTLAVEVLELSPPTSGELSTQAELPGERGERPSVKTEDPLELDEPPPPSPQPVSRPVPDSRPSEPDPSEPDPSEPDPSEPDPLPDADRDASGDPVEADGAAPVEASPDTEAGDEGTSRGGGGGVPSSQAGHGSSQGEGGLSGDGDFDYSAYGAEIVRRVLHEIDEDPVPGIADGHVIQIELRLRPDGRLAPHGLGRFDFARVLRSTLGPLRNRWILRRVERAAKHFPPHPEGFSRKVYELDFTIQFKDGRVKR